MIVPGMRGTAAALAAIAPNARLVLTDTPPAGQGQILRVFKLDFSTTGERGFSWKTLVTEYDR
jgi:hypothetical protein